MSDYFEMRAGAEALARGGTKMPTLRDRFIRQGLIKPETVFETQERSKDGIAFGRPFMPPHMVHEYGERLVRTGFLKPGPRSKFFRVQRKAWMPQVQVLQ